MNLQARVTVLFVVVAPFAPAPTAAQLPDVQAPPAAQVELGRLLFWDPILSGEQDVACVTFGESERGVGGRRRGDRGDRDDGPSVSRDFRRVDDMTPQQMEDIVAFLNALTDERFDRTEPGRVPSGLPRAAASGRAPDRPPLRHHPPPLPTSPHLRNLHDS
jgi:hypothetical protein